MKVCRFLIYFSVVTAWLAQSPKCAAEKSMHILSKHVWARARAARVWGSKKLKSVPAKEGVAK
jgi:hypothetical protein